MIVYLANKTRFRADILSNRIEFNIPQTGKRVDFIVTGTRGDGQRTAMNHLGQILSFSA